MNSDGELLAEFARTNSQDAFEELVRRYVNLVYSAALRQVGGDEHLAKDVAQVVFSDLAKKAGSLVRRVSLTGWLYTSTRFAAAKIVRSENRRRNREETFMRESTNGTAFQTEWETLRPALDDALHQLKESDREAILLRYFENRPFSDVGMKLGLNENAARMRVDRALEKLKAVFAKHGVATTAAFAAAISANAVQLAPANLATTLTATATAATTGGTFTLFKIMTAAKLKLGLAAFIVAGSATAFVLQQQAQNKLRGENTVLQQQIARLQTDNSSLSNRMAVASESRRLSDEQFNELLKLRGEVTVLRRQVSDFKKTKAEQTRKMEEMSAAARSQLATDRAEAKFKADEVRGVNNVKQICLAFHIVAGDHNDQYPTNINDDVMNSLGSTNLIAYAQTEIELVNQWVPNQNDHPNMIQMRERTARQSPDGKWRRIYGLVDGSVHVAESSNGNFEEWERQMTEIPQFNQ